jgi:hypothetical protein
MRHFLSVTLVSAVLCLSPVICCAAQAEQPDPYEDTSVLVEAFVVEVQNEALAEAGVNPIGQTPENVTPLKILWCLKDDDKAQVISGAKVACRHKGEAKAKTSDSFYIKREVTRTTQTSQGQQAVTDVKFDEHRSGVTFTVIPNVKSDDVLSIIFSYSESGIKRQEDKTSLPDTFTYDWQSRLTLHTGKPVIAAALQGETTTTFLVLTATIQTMDTVQP